MLNLNYFQTLFNEDNTEIRCRKVLDEVSPVIKPLFKRFAEKVGISLEDEYYIRSYDTTLSTTYHDARNPTYAEKKKNSDTGRKYSIGIYMKTNEKEHNLFMLELNGIEQSILIHTEINFIPFWSWYKNNRMETLLQSIPTGYTILTGQKEKVAIPKEQLTSFVKDCIKPRKRPLFQIGTSLPLKGEQSEEAIVEKLVEVWNALGEFRSMYRNELSTSKQAFDA